MLDFAERLKSLRTSSNLTQKQLATETGFSERGIQNYELRTRKPNSDTIINLADYFDVSTDYLLGRTDNPKVNR